MSSRVASPYVLLGAVFASMALSGAARAEDDDASGALAPLAGDLVNGAKRYRLDCASCHGLTGGGDGVLANGLNPHPARLREGTFLWSHSDEEILDAITGVALPAGAPMHGQHLSRLDARDILAWLRDPVLEVGDLFPKTTDYIAHLQEIDSDGKDRAEQILGRPLTDKEAHVMVFTTYSPDGDAKANGHPTKAAEDEASLYAMKPRRRAGFVTFQTLNLSEGPIDVAMAMSNQARLIDLRTMPSEDPKVEKAREKLNKLLRSYIGSGGRVDKKPVEPHEKGLKAPKDVQVAMLLAFERLLEGEAMFLKEEQRRFQLDPDAFNFPAAADQPDNVKFDFKQQKNKH